MGQFACRAGQPPLAGLPLISTALGFPTIKLAERDVGRHVLNNLFCYPPPESRESAGGFCEHGTFLRARPSDFSTRVDVRPRDNLGRLRQQGEYQTRVRQD
jgi:hypothetical protein